MREPDDYTEEDVMHYQHQEEIEKLKAEIGNLTGIICNDYEIFNELIGAEYGLYKYKKIMQRVLRQHDEAGIIHSIHHIEKDGLFNT